MSTEKLSAVLAILESIFHNASALAEFHSLPELNALAYLAESAQQKLEE